MNSYYQKQQLQVAFSAWKTYYFHRKVNWRSIIKAEVHYTFQLRLKFFKIWQLNTLEAKSAKIKNKIAKMFYEKRLKQMYFSWLKYNTKNRLYSKKMSKILIEELVIYHSHLELLIYSYTFVCLKLNMLADNFSIWKWKTVYLKRYFEKLLNYVNYIINKRNLNEKANSFLKSKYDPKVLHPYFQKWIIWTNYSLERKNKFATAENHYKDKLLWKSFKRLLMYANYAQEKREKVNQASQHYKIKTLNYILTCWIRHTNRRLLKNNRNTEAAVHYLQKLKYNCFNRIIKYNERKKRNKHLFILAKERCEYKIKIKYFEKLKKYWNCKKINLYKFNIASRYYDEYLLKYYFLRFKLYYNCQRTKKQNHELLINTLKQKHNVRRLNFWFQQWKYLKIISQKEKQSITESETFYKTTLLHRTFVQWRTYTRNKIYLRYRNEGIIKRVTIIKWRNFIRRQAQFKNKLELARNMYEKNLLSKGLTFFIKVGSETQNLKKQKALNMFEKEFQLQFKYYCIWKRKSLTNFKQLHRFTRGQSSLYRINEVFQWNNLCFEKPKIPDNFY